MPGPNSQPQSLWASQRPYYDSAINRLATHFGPPASPDPCQPALTKLQDSFSAPANIYFYAYFRDYQNSLPAQLKIYHPDGSIFKEWTYSAANPPFSSAWNPGWVYAVAPTDPAGTYRFEAVYNGQVYQTFFNVNDPTQISISAPNGGEQWDRRTAHTITWQDNLGGDVNIALYRSGIYSTTLASNFPSSGAFPWTPGTALPAGPGYTVRITSVISPGLSAESSAPFSLTNIALTARDDFGMTTANTPVTINVLGNDTFPASTAHHHHRRRADSPRRCRAGECPDRLHPHAGLPRRGCVHLHRADQPRPGSGRCDDLGGKHHPAGVYAGDSEDKEIRI